MRKVKIGKRTVVAAAAILVLCVGLAYGAVVNYLSNTIEKPVTVESPIDLSGKITYKTIRYEVPPSTPPTIDGVLSPGEWGEPLCTATGAAWGYPGVQSITVYAYATLEYLYLAFDTSDATDNRNASGLDVLDWNVGLVGSEPAPNSRDPSLPFPWRYAVVSKVSPDNYWEEYSKIDNGYYAAWRDTWALAEIGQYHFTIPEGIEMATSFETGKRVTEFKVPMSIMFDGEHGWEGPNPGDVLLLGGTFSGEDTNGENFEMVWWPEGWNDKYEETFAKYTIGVPVVVTETFNGTKFSETLHGGDEFSMSFNATNLANRPVEAPLALVMECPSTWEGGYPIPEIAEIEPAPSAYGYSSDNEYLVLVFDELYTIGPGATNEAFIRMQLAPNAEPSIGDSNYVIKALIAWEGVVSGENVVLGDDFAKLANARSTSDEHYLGDSSWTTIPGYPPENHKMELYILGPWYPTPLDKLGKFTISDIKSISWATKKPTAGDQPDFYVSIYTEPYEGGDSDWYGHRLTLEGMYSPTLNAPANQWNIWSTDEGDNQVTLIDSNHGPIGYYGAPTLAEIQSGSITWHDEKTIDYRNQKVMAISVSTGTPWCETFVGYLDAITVELKNGQSITIDLEDHPLELTLEQVNAIVSAAS